MDDFEKHLAEAREADAATDWPRAAEAYERALADLAPAAGSEQAGVLTSLGRCLRHNGEARPAWRSAPRWRFPGSTR